MNRTPIMRAAAAAALALAAATPGYAAGVVAEPLPKPQSRPATGKLLLGLAALGLLLAGTAPPAGRSGPDPSARSARSA